ncbi:MAG: hypothetical protein IBX64_13740 [Actinobacteria bacterium]|nr:hypothetical protein [Actinomycetota bacterium]
MAKKIKNKGGAVQVARSYNPYAKTDVSDAALRKVSSPPADRYVYRHKSPGGHDMIKK